MKKILVKLMAAALIFAGFAVTAGDERPVVLDNVPVRVKYQMKRPNSNTWTTATTTLRGAVSEAMMENQIAARCPGQKVRILAASIGAPARSAVRYQVKRGAGAWSASSTILTDALTSSMAKHQIEARYPGAAVRILSMTAR